MIPKKTVNMEVIVESQDVSIDLRDAVDDNASTKTEEKDEY